MDPITHGVLGAACAQAALGKYDKRIPWQAGTLAGMAPDLDVFIRFSQEPLSLEQWHRYLTHSLMFIPIGGLIVALFLLCFSQYRQYWKITIGASLVGYATHCLLDSLTSYGTVLFWPWSDSRISWDIISIIDPVFTLPLLLGTAWSVIYQNQKAVTASLFFCILFLIFNTILHNRAVDGIHQYATTNNFKINHPRALPKLASSTYWRIIAKQQDCLIIAEAKTSLFSPTTIRLIRQALSFNESIIPFALSSGQKNDLATFHWFTDGFLIVANKNPLILADARYTIDDSPLFSLWGIEILPGQEHINKLSLPKINEYCKSTDSERYKEDGLN
ncbi:TPA: metal-dependent hydrolase [Legionella pneumophila]|nr:metal-dependent hydrolase [Legionella pneumophila]HAT2066458.1 metal-dependent hydrolase [Legionella pneumophila]HAT8592299.1 metal-dependent hydrolase [Legionella pneumophila]HAU1576847.1 metal-dependent hydrolase [Legionella pneumophila]HAU1680834.1 metal-dependent hydrolase [Legionella pneumophila]HAU3700541.1 metal-dependent hydrolase [Legionella pneumophila]